MATGIYLALGKRGVIKTSVSGSSISISRAKERTPAPLSRAQPLITSSDINKLSSEGCIFFAPFSLFDDHVVIVCLLRGREKGVFLGRDGSERIANVFIEQ